MHSRDRCQRSYEIRDSTSSTPTYTRTRTHRQVVTVIFAPFFSSRTRRSRGFGSDLPGRSSERGVHDEGRSPCSTLVLRHTHTGLRAAEGRSRRCLMDEGAAGSACFCPHARWCRARLVRRLPCLPGHGERLSARPPTSRGAHQLASNLDSPGARTVFRIETRLVVTFLPRCCSLYVNIAGCGGLGQRERSFVLSYM